MDAWMLSEERASAEAGRRRPRAPHRHTFTAAGNGRHGREAAPDPTDLYLEATDPTGEVALWFDDIWWMESLRRWGHLSLVIHVLPSEAALLHPVVLHHVAMMDRVAQNWRVAGYGYAGEVAGDAAVERLATSAYHEVHFVEGVRPTARNSSPERFALRIEDLFARVRRVQQEMGATRPILVRAKSIPVVPGDTSAAETVESNTAGQTCG